MSYKIKMLTGTAHAASAVIEIDKQVTIVRDYPIEPGTTTSERENILVNEAFKQQGKERPSNDD